MSIAVEWGRAPKTLPAQRENLSLAEAATHTDACNTARLWRHAPRPHQHSIKLQALTGHTVLGIVGGVDELDCCAVRHGQREDVQESQEANPAIVPAIKRGFLNLPDT